MSSISTSTGVFSSFLTQDAFRFDQNGDGKLSRPEIAKAALSLENSDPKLSSLLATFVVGGRDGNGLLPDFNGDGQLDRFEAQSFAQADVGQATSFMDAGNRANTITTDDFKAVFGSQAVDGGQAIDDNKLRQIAGQQPAPVPGTTPGGSSQDNLLLTLVLTVLTVLLQAFSRKQQANFS